MEERWNDIIRMFLCHCYCNLTQIASSAANPIRTHITFEESCSEWLNLSTFLARCLGAGLCDADPYPGKHPFVDIPIGLKEDLAPGLERDCKAMVSVQWILLAGQKIVELSFSTSMGVSGPEQWKRWREVFAEIEKGVGTYASEVRNAAGEARKYMDVLRPAT